LGIHPQDVTKQLPLLWASLMHSPTKFSVFHYEEGSSRGAKFFNNFRTTPTLGPPRKPATLPISLPMAKKRACATARDALRLLCSNSPDYCGPRTASDAAGRGLPLATCRSSTDSAGRNDGRACPMRSRGDRAACADTLVSAKKGGWLFEGAQTFGPPDGDQGVAPSLGLIVNGFGRRTSVGPLEVNE